MNTEDKIKDYFKMKELTDEQLDSMNEYEMLEYIDSGQEFKKEGNDMKQLTNKEMVDHLLRSLNLVKNELADVKEKCSSMNKVNQLAIEGLIAIAKFGDSQNIAIKTMEQINSISKED